jgi:hypothetical protein
VQDSRSLIIVVAIVAIVALAVGIWIAGALRRIATRRRSRVAFAGEVEAEALLRGRGYKVVERQARATFHICVDGADVPIEVRADLIVSRRGRTYVAEVKTGSIAPDPTHGPTRRQLLEYALVFRASEVLLVDVPAGAIREVSFPAI